MAGEKTPTPGLPFEFPEAQGKAPAVPSVSQDKARTPEQLTQEQKAAAKERDHRRLEQMMQVPSFTEAVFKAPDEDHKTEHETQAAFDRNMNDPAYKALHERVMASVTNLARRVSEEVQVKGLSQEEMYEKTRTALMNLQTQLGTSAQSIKTHNTKHSRAEMPAQAQRGRIDPREEVMNYDELIELGNHIEQFERINPKEIHRMLEEDKDYTNMLFQQMTRDRGAALIGSQNDPSAQAMIDSRDPSKRDLSLDNPNVVKNYRRLVRFISGDPEEQGGEQKSETRKNAERPLWMEIVRNMDGKEKKYLVEQFAAEKGLEQAKAFIQMSVAAGTIRIREITRWTMDAQTQQESTIFQQFDKPFLDSLNVVADMKRAAQEDVQEFVEGQDKTNLDSAAEHYLTFNNFLYSRLMDVGTLAVLVSMIVNVSERWNHKDDHDRKESAVKAFVLGVRDGLINRSTIFGVTSAAIGINGISPFFGKMMYSPSSKEKALVERNHEMIKLDDMFSDRPRLATFLLDNFEEMHTQADLNKENQHVGHEMESRGEFALWPKDIQQYATVDNTLKADYTDRARFGADLFHSFRITTSVLDIHTKEDLKKYLVENEYLVA